MKAPGKSARSGICPAFLRLTTRSQKGGFTLLELIVVIAILAILSGLTVAATRFARLESKVKRAEAELQMLKSALEEYRVEYGRYPEMTEDGKFPQTAAMLEWLEDVSLYDPWGQPYKYVNEERFVYSLWSEGPDPERSGDEIGKKYEEVGLHVH